MIQDNGSANTFIEVYEFDSTKETYKKNRDTRDQNF
jgi:hypothetical protein